VKRRDKWKPFISAAFSPSRRAVVPIPNSDFQLVFAAAIHWLLKTFWLSLRDFKIFPLLAGDVVGILI